MRLYALAADGVGVGVGDAGTSMAAFWCSGTVFGETERLQAQWKARQRGFLRLCHSLECPSIWRPVPPDHPWWLFSFLIPTGVTDPNRGIVGVSVHDVALLHEADRFLGSEVLGAEGCRPLVVAWQAVHPPAERWWCWRWQANNTPLLGGCDFPLSPITRVRLISVMMRWDFGPQLAGNLMPLHRCSCCSSPIVALHFRRQSILSGLRPMATI